MKFKYWLTSLTDISNAKKKLLHDCSITAEKLFFMPKDELSDILFFTDEDRKIILESRASYDVEKEWILFQQKDIGFVTMEDEAYPDKLRNIHNPPYSLFYIGALPDKTRKSVAIVGARGRSAYGCEVAKVLAAALSRQGIQIISGMARGIDRDAHMGCLEAGGNTYAVLGSGADTCYPKENRFLYDKIKLSGGIISELMPGTDPQKMFFPMRNRIISGLSDIVVIVEAKKRSGSLITADFAMEQGKDVYVIPGRITDTLSYGCAAQRVVSGFCGLPPGFADGDQHRPPLTGGQLGQRPLDGSVRHRGFNGAAADVLRITAEDLQSLAVHRQIPLS